MYRMIVNGKYRRFSTIEDATRAAHDLFEQRGVVAEIRLETPEDKRRRRNAIARARYGALRDLGMVKTPYGWE